MTVLDLPHVNATLNSISTLLIVIGYVMIRRKRIAIHRACMLSATAVSAAFLLSYLIYHYHAGHTKFTEEGSVRYVYLTILFTHVVLATAVPFLVGLAIYHAVRNQLEQHRRIVRWALPIWLYVSVTGVVVYLMLYQLYPPQSV